MKRISRIVALIVAALALSTSLTACMTTPGPGEIGVTRNGGTFDNHRIRGCDGKPPTSDCGIVKNGSGNTGNGVGSETHYYPVDTQQRYFTMCTRIVGGQAQPCEGADALAPQVPTSDGVEAQIEGTIYLNTVFSNTPQGYAAVKAFDTQFSTRTFPPDNLHAYDKNKGWSAFLSSIVEPIVVNNLRETIGGVKCAELVSSCALVQNGSQNPAQKVKAVAGQNNQSNIQRIQDAVAQGLADDLQQTLKRQYFGNISFKLSRVVLPPSIQGAINQAQSAFAQVSQAQARVASARADARANALKERGYNACPACAQIDANKAWKGTGVTTVVQGGSSVAVGGGR